MAPARGELNPAHVRQHPDDLPDRDRPALRRPPPPPPERWLPASGLKQRAAAYPEDASGAVDAVVERDAVLSALRALPARQREVVVLRLYADLSVPETARAMGSSEGTVKSYTACALRLKELLANPTPAISQHDEA
ncbi:MAG: sigma factor-like helix-turn-helix DNA-binding protein [Solirubrobacteraceae bacterium]